MSNQSAHITTHILDTSSGTPAQGVEISLFGHDNGDWKEIGSGQTNSDGRIADIHEGKHIGEGIYKMKFFTKEYFGKSNIETFYPFVEIVFSVKAGEHYHVPLLLNPFGYTTYRGS